MVQSDTIIKNKIMNKNTSRNIETNKKGFTLLELLIVITIISVLSVILIVALNPAETLRKARDTQRLSDLASLKTAIGIYVTTKTSPLLDNDDNTACQTVQGTDDSGTTKLWYSTATAVTGTLDATPTPAKVRGDQVTAAELGEVDGTGWLPVNLGSITGGSPISNLPIDPVNDGGAVTSASLVYRYACAADTLTFEINAQLESIAFTDDDDKREKDGGNNVNYYEVGTATNIIGTGTDF